MSDTPFDAAEWDAAIAQLLETSSTCELTLRADLVVPLLIRLDYASNMARRSGAEDPEQVQIMEELLGALAVASPTLGNLLRRHLYFPRHQLRADEVSPRFRDRYSASHADPPPAGPPAGGSPPPNPDLPLGGTHDSL